MTRKTILLSMVGLIFWSVATYVFWIGYTGMDDLTYCRYAYSFHRLPLDWREFRIPAVLAIRLSFLALGPSEFSAVLPGLLTSLILFMSVAWFVDKPNGRGWQFLASLLLAATLPLDVHFRSTAMAPYMSAGLLAAGTVALLKGQRYTPYFGALLMAIAFMTHEMSFYYIAILCFTAMGFDFSRYWRPVAICVLLSGLLFFGECFTYYLLTGNFGERFANASTGIGDIPATETDKSWDSVEFFTWPLKNLVFCSTFGSDLGLLFLFGIYAFKEMSKTQKILLCTMILFWLFLGFGSMVPWDYQPIYRQFHYYFVLTLGVAALLPQSVRYAFGNREWLSRFVILGALGLHLFCLSAGGRWNQRAQVAREMYHYAQQHPSENFVTDVNSMNMMIAEANFQLPNNVFCLNGADVDQYLKLNREPEGTPLVVFPEKRIHGILVNNEWIEPAAPEYVDAGEQFREFLAKYDDQRVEISPVKYRLIFVPLLPWMQPRDFMIRSFSAELVEIDDEVWVNRN